jgi:formate dehydrogenase iron-sulfur subunit
MNASQQKAILIDTTLCNGCEKCIVACKEENDLGKDRPWRGQQSIDGLSATRWSTIIRKASGHFVRNQCRHCVEPACVSACIVGALKKLPEGPVVYDPDKCMGCRYCMLACPYSIPRYDWDRNTPLVQKCIMCAPRLEQGRPPACVEACPENAMIFGTRDEMLAEGHRRIAARGPGKYQPKVYGETEVGGTCVLLVSDIPLDFLLYDPSVGEQSLPQLSWAALKKVPGVVLGVGALMAGTYWVIGRRMKLASLNAAADIEKAEAETAVPADSQPDVNTGKNDE